MITSGDFCQKDPEGLNGLPIKEPTENAAYTP